jgi:hypothetical protein
MECRWIVMLLAGAPEDPEVYQIYHADDGYSYVWTGEAWRVTREPFDGDKFDTYAPR